MGDFGGSEARQIWAKEAAPVHKSVTAQKMLDGAAYLMEDTAVVRRDIPRVEEETFLHCRTGQTGQFPSSNFNSSTHVS